MASVIGFGPVRSGREKIGRSNRQAREGTPPVVNRLIESEVIPRLLVAHSSGAGPPIPSSGAISEEEVERFAPLALSLEAHALLAEVERFLRRGLSAEQVFVDLLAPAARQLGEEWMQDRIDFIDVTMGLWRLQEVLREIALRTPPIIQLIDQAHAALFSPIPGDQHSFGTAMIEECFARAGWRTQLMVEPSRGELLARVANGAFDIVGLTVSNDCHIAGLPFLITALRNVSKNPEVRILLGGRVLIDDPDLAVEAGADGTAPTALAALDCADRLVRAPLHAAIA